MSTFSVSPYAWDDREATEVFHCVNKACGFVTRDSDKLIYADADEAHARLDDMFCPHCGSPIEIEEEEPQLRRPRR